MNVLDLSIDELNAMSTEELQKLHTEAVNGASLHDTSQLVLKLMINGLYGALANKWFPLFNEKMAQAITGNGRFFIRLLANNVNARLQELIPNEEHYVVYGDTDSIFFTIEPFVTIYEQKNPEATLDEKVTFADEFEQKVIEPVIQATIDELAKKLNAYNKDIIGANREIIADSAVFVAKKRYYARVRDNEGKRYPEYAPEFKVMGLEIAKSSTPVWSKQKLSEAIEHILDKSEDELRMWVKGIKTEFTSNHLDNVATVGASSNLDYVLGGEKTVPFGSRAAIVHNNYITENSLEGVYQPIEAGDKAKRIFLVEPNKFESNIIAYQHSGFVNEIQDIVDWDMQWEKGFLSALENMLKGLDYDIRKETETLDDW